jgi:hypothetical protein
MQKKTIQNRLLLACGVVAPLLCVTTFTIDGATRPGYQPLHQWVSHLSLGPRGWLGTVNLAITGLLLLGFSRGLWRVMQKGRGSKWGPRLMAMTGAGFIVAALFAIDPGLGYPPGVRAATGSWHDGLHKVGALLLFGSLAANTFVFRRRFKRGWRVYSISSGLGVIAALIISSMLAALDYSGKYVGAPTGLFERIALAIGLGWVCLLASRLFQSANPYISYAKTYSGNKNKALTSSRDRVSQTNRFLAEEHIQPMYTQMAIADVPAEKALQVLFNMRGDAAANRSAYLMARAHVELTVRRDGDYLTFNCGGEQPANFDGWIDKEGRRLVLQGHWWYRGEFIVEPDGAGSRVIYNVYNIAPRSSRWMVPLMQRRFPVTMKSSLETLAEIIKRPYPDSR